MMRRRTPLFLFWTLALLTTWCHAQENITIEATIVDLMTGEALPFTNVIIENTAIGTVSNEEGVFELTVSKKYAQSNVVFSFMGYQNKIVPLSKFKDPRQKVYIESAATPLEEIVVEAKNKYQEYVGEAIQQIPINYAKEAVHLDAYYRELTQIEGHYTKFTDAATVLYYSPYTTPYDPNMARVAYMRFDKRDTEKQSTPFPDPVDLIAAVDDQAKIRAVRKSENLQQYKLLDTASKKVMTIDPNDLKWLENSEIGGGPLRLCGADKIKRRMDFFDPKKYNDYHFKLIKRSSFNDRPVYVIGFKPKDATTCKVNYRGQLTMDQQSKAIIAYSYRPTSLCKKQMQQQFGTHLKTPDSIQRTQKIDFIRRTTILEDFEVKVTYSFYSNQWHLKTIKTTNYYRNEGDFFDSYRAMTTSELLVNEVSNENVAPFPTYEIFDTTFSNALFNTERLYDPVFWQNYSTMVPTGIVGKALEDLETKSSLEAQFRLQQK